MPFWLVIIISLAMLVVFSLPAWWPEKEDKNGKDKRTRDTRKRK